MGQLLVRELDDEVVAELKRQAAANGRSAEAEHREILRNHLLAGRVTRRTFKEILAAMPDAGLDSDFDVR